VTKEHRVGKYKTGERSREGNQTKIRKDGEGQTGVTIKSDGRQEWTVKKAPIEGTQRGKKKRGKTEEEGVKRLVDSP